MTLVIALGGNALLPRGQALTPGHQLARIELAAAQLARLAQQHSLVLTHGNGPQVGLLALQAEAAEPGSRFPLDVLGAETEGMIGYLLEQALVNQLPPDRPVACLLTRVEVDPKDPALASPSKPIGPHYTEAQARRLAAERGWVVAADGEGFRRVVASPQPLALPALPSIRCLLAQGTLVIAAGGGGIPVARQGPGQALHGLEAVIDKDLCSSLLARLLPADGLLIVTDVDAVYQDWGQPTQRAIRQIHPQQLAGMDFAVGSMAPKVQAACAFVLATGRPAVIGALEDIEALWAGTAGTRVTLDAPASAVDAGLALEQPQEGRFV